MPDRSFSGDFVGVKHIKTRGVYQFIVEVQEDQAQSALEQIGGLPRASESRLVAVTSLTELSI